MVCDVVFLVVSKDARGPGKRCVERLEYYSRIGSCYKFHRHPKTWPNAARVCHAEGGHLAIVNSQSEADLITEIFRKNPVDTVIGAVHNDVAHIGIWKWEDNTDGEWLTIHGQTLNKAGYEKWGKNQPNNWNGIQHVGSIERGGGLNDIAFYHLVPFICEITP